MALLRSVWPAKWIPGFRRGDWVDEEVVKQPEIVGHYDPLEIIGDLRFETTDETHGKKLEIEFSGGNIYLCERREIRPSKSRGWHRRIFGELFLEWIRSGLR